MAPLEEASIHKMLTVNVASRNLSPEAHAIWVMQSALDEWFFYGRTEYQARCADMRRVVEMCDLERWVPKSMFLQYDDMIARFEENSKYVDDFEPFEFSYEE